MYIYTLSAVSLQVNGVFCVLPAPAKVLSDTLDYLTAPIEMAFKSVYINTLSAVSLQVNSVFCVLPAPAMVLSDTLHYLTAPIEKAFRYIYIYPVHC